METHVSPEIVMNPALKILGPAVVLNGLAIVGLFLTNRADWAVAILAGALLPVVISTVSLWLFARKRKLKFKQAQAFMLYSFMAKMILMGLWVVLMVTSENIDLLPFVSSLLINFLAWHLSEAYHIRPLLEQVVSENLEQE